MLSVNAAMQVDLFAQANASFVDKRIHSGFGGQPDFVTGALHSPGGHAIVALHAWHHKTDTSTVVPVLTTRSRRSNTRPSSASTVVPSFSAARSTRRPS